MNLVRQLGFIERQDLAFRSRVFLTISARCMLLERRRTLPNWADIDPSPWKEAGVTSSIDARTRARATNPPPSEPVTGDRARLIFGIRLFTAAGLAAGLGLGVADVASHGGVHLVIPSATCFMLSGLSATILIVHALLADRQEFYRRGQLDGWMRGWRGQEPEIDDPLLH